MNELQYNLFGSIINNINIEIMEHGNFTGDSEWKYYNINSPFNRLYFVLEGLGHIRNKCEETDIRITKAKELLLYSSFNITEIASIVDYDNSFYFSRIFKKNTALSPREYKNKR